MEQLKGQLTELTNGRFEEMKELAASESLEKVKVQAAELTNGAFQALQRQVEELTSSTFEQINEQVTELTSDSVMKLKEQVAELTTDTMEQLRAELTSSSSSWREEESRSRIKRQLNKEVINLPTYDYLLKFNSKTNIILFHAPAF
jgi:hypothetical protein